ERDSASRAVKPASARASTRLRVRRASGCPGRAAGGEPLACLPRRAWNALWRMVESKVGRSTAHPGVSGWCLHDLRRTLATGPQRLGVRLEVTEAVLNHAHRATRAAG